MLRSFTIVLIIGLSHKSYPRVNLDKLRKIKILKPLGHREQKLAPKSKYELTAIMIVILEFIMTLKLSLLKWNALQILNLKSLEANKST